MRSTAAENRRQYPPVRSGPDLEPALQLLSCARTLRSGRPILKSQNSWLLY